MRPAVITTYPELAATPPLVAPLSFVTIGTRNGKNANAQNGGGDKYTGLDRFGRIVGEHWVEPTESSSERQWAKAQYGKNYDSTSPALNQTRSHNRVNEISNITGPSGVADPTFDDAGNMTFGP